MVVAKVYTLKSFGETHYNLSIYISRVQKKENRKEEHRKVTISCEHKPLKR